VPLEKLGEIFFKLDNPRIIGVESLNETDLTISQNVKVIGEMLK